MSPINETRAPDHGRPSLAHLHALSRIEPNVPFVVSVTLATDASGATEGRVVWGTGSSENARIAPTPQQARALLDLLDGSMK